MKKRFLAALLCAAAACLLFAGCGSDDTSSAIKVTETSSDESSEDEEESGSDTSSDEEYTGEVFAMDTYMTLTAYGANAQEAVEAGIAEIERLDALFSVGVETSDVALINESSEGELSEETLYLVERALEIYESTGGAFDITVYPVMDLWGFTTGDYAVPSADALDAALSLVDASLIEVTENEDGTGYITLGEGQQIDLGGIAKGYASGRVLEIFEEYGIESALINLGGNAHVLGNKVDGSQWRVAIQDPEDDSSYIGGVSVTGKAIITSGGYERYFEDEETGTTYHHIIDPDTGYSANNGLISVTIVSEDSTLADGLSTSLFVMGTEDAIAYCEENCDALGFDAVLETEDGDIYITDNIEDDFIDTNGNTVLNVIETN